MYVKKGLKTILTILIGFFVISYTHAVDVIPSATALISPTNNTTDTTPTYTWNPVSNATWYYLWVNDSTGNKIKIWYSTAQAGCANGIDTCSVTPATTLASGSAKWWVQTWNNQGYGPWSTALNFSINNTDTPISATLVSPVNNITDITPTYTWNAISNATWYYLWVNDSAGNKIKTWYTAAQAGCANGTDTCSVTPATTLTSGSAQWWVQAWNDAGYGPWSSVANFYLNNDSTSWNTMGPGGGGWLSTITIVNDSTHTVYAACDVGGVYKSTDHGQTWTIKNNGFSMYYVQDIAYDPLVPTTLYAATRGGIYKTSNGGDSWEIKRSGFPPADDFSFSAPVSDIAVDPSNPNIIYAGIGVPRSGYELDSYHWQSAGIKGAIYKSVDYGENWVLIQNTGIDISAMIYSLAIDPENTNVLYAATSSGIYKSSNAGASWSPKNSGLPHQLAMTIVIDPQNTNTLYVTLWAEPGSQNWQGGVYKSVNGGEQWVARNNGLPQQMGEEYGFTNNYPQIVIDKNNPQILYVGNTPWTPDPGVYKTINGGTTWEWVSRGDADDTAVNVDVGWITEHGISVKSLAIDPIDSDRLYFGTSTHLIKTEDAGASWQQTYTEAQGNNYWAGNGLETTVVAAVAIDPSNSNNIYAGYWDMGFLKSMDGGASFKRTFVGMNYNSNTFAIIVDPVDNNVIYAASGWWEENKGAVYKSTNYGETWVQLGIGLPDAQVWSMALDETSPVNSRTIYATSYENGVYKTIDGGQHWSQINTGLGVSGNLQVKKIVIDPSNSNILYAGIEAKQIEIGNSNSTVQGGVFKSTDAGAHWNRIDSNLPQINVRDIDIAVAADNSTIIYTSVKSEYDHTLQEAFIGGVYKSSNGGGSWTRVNTGFGNQDNLNVASLAISPVNSNTLYAVTTDAPFHDQSAGRGIFKSTNAGESWVSVGSESHIKDYEFITIDPTNPSVLYAGSSGNGLLKGIDHSLLSND